MEKQPPSSDSQGPSWPSDNNQVKLAPAFPAQPGVGVGGVSGDAGPTPYVTQHPLSGREVASLMERAKLRGPGTTVERAQASPAAPVGYPAAAPAGLVQQQTGTNGRDSAAQSLFHTAGVVSRVVPSGSGGVGGVGLVKNNNTGLQPEDYITVPSLLGKGAPTGAGRSDRLLTQTVLSDESDDDDTFLRSFGGGKRAMKRSSEDMDADAEITIAVDLSKPPPGGDITAAATTNGDEPRAKMRKLHHDEDDSAEHGHVGVMLSQQQHDSLNVSLDTSLDDGEPIMSSSQNELMTLGQGRATASATADDSFRLTSSQTSAPDSGFAQDSFIAPEEDEELPEISRHASPARRSDAANASVIYVSGAGSRGEFLMSATRSGGATSPGRGGVHVTRAGVEPGGLIPSAVTQQRAQLQSGQAEPRAKITIEETQPQQIELSAGVVTSPVPASLAGGVVTSSIQASLPSGLTSAVPASLLGGSMTSSVPVCLVGSSGNRAVVVDSASGLLRLSQNTAAATIQVPSGQVQRVLQPSVPGVQLRSVQPVMKPDGGAAGKSQLVLFVRPPVESLLKPKGGAGTADEKEAGAAAGRLVATSSGGGRWVEQPAIRPRHPPPTALQPVTPGMITVCRAGHSAPISMPQPILIPSTHTSAQTTPITPKIPEIPRIRVMPAVPSTVAHAVLTSGAGYATIPKMALAATPTVLTPVTAVSSGGGAVTTLAVPKARVISVQSPPALGGGATAVPRVLAAGTGAPSTGGGSAKPRALKVTSRFPCFLVCMASKDVALSVVRPVQVSLSHFCSGQTIAFSWFPSLHCVRTTPGHGAVSVPVQFRCPIKFLRVKPTQVPYPGRETDALRSCTTFKVDAIGVNLAISMRI